MMLGLRLRLSVAVWLLATTITALLEIDDNWKELPIPPGFEDNPLSRRSLANNVVLRICPLGASIVWGYEATTTAGNGFRYGLRNQLVYGGNAVNMIGSVQHGTMVDNDVEGWPGYVITQVAQKAELSIPSQPNVVLLHVGLNDMGQNIDIGNAHLRLGVLIDRLFDAIPGVTVIASTLLPNADPTIQQRIQIYNANIPPMLAERQEAGKKVTYVDFSSSWFSVSDLGPDGSHPTDAGYLKMAAVWYQGILVANGQGWLTPPAAVAGVNDLNIPSSITTCDKVPGNAIGPIQTQMGSGLDDGPYVHTADYLGSFSITPSAFMITTSDDDPKRVFWADINGDGIDDFVYYYPNTEGIGVALSLGGGNFGEFSASAFFLVPSSACDLAGVAFADVTGDGRDDFCCIQPNGDLQCWENTQSTNAAFPEFVAMGIIQPNQGYPRAQVRLADIDGDGRADYVCLNAAGTHIYGWRNQANAIGPPQSWTPMDGVAIGLPVLSPLSGWGFVDLNGDHKDDLVWINAEGQVTTWINQRGFNVGLAPVWASMGVTHTGFTVLTNASFGAFVGSGRADYSTVTYHSDGHLEIGMYENLDHGGTMSKGDGSRYCDMTGTGSDDYIWINSVGLMTLYGNNHVWGTWNQYGVIYNINRARRDIQFADFDGDGFCDILLVDKATGATTVLKNSYDSSTRTFTFTDIGVVTGSATCTQGYGYDRHDNGVRWADLDGDKRADFLCMEPNGRITGYLNKGVGNMVNQGQIKFSEGRERKNLRIADIDGDGRADMLWLDNRSGQMVAWHNNGPISSGGSSWNWVLKGVVAGGNTARGSAIELTNLNGLGRADYLCINPQTNKAWVFLNVCPGGTLAAATPNLPTGAPPAPTYPLCGSNGACGSVPTATISSSVATGTPFCNDNGDGSCDITVDSNIGITLPADTYLVPFLTPSYSVGDALLFDTPDPSDLLLNIRLTGGETAWEDTNCNSISASGVDGDTLGCVAISVAWLVYSIYMDGGPIGTDPTTGIPQRSLPQSDYSFKLNSEWEPDGNCTSKCKLSAGAPNNTWVSVGNGTYNGVYHELHFVQTEKRVGYRAVQGGSYSNFTLLAPSGNSTLAARDYQFNHQYDNMWSSTIYSDDNQLIYRASQMPGGELSEWFADSVEKTVAVSNMSVLCVSLLERGTPDSTVLLGISQGLGTPWIGSELQAEELELNCEDEETQEVAGSAILLCGRNLTTIDPSLLDDPDGDLEPNIFARSIRLVKRTGGTVEYSIENALDPGGVTVTWESATYYNEDNGQQLIDHGSDPHVFGLANPVPCWDTSIRDDCPIAGVNAIAVDAEHILERVTMPYFFEFIQTATLDLLDGNGPIRAPANLDAVPFFVVRDYMAIPYVEWPVPVGVDDVLTGIPSTESLFTDVADSLGSTQNTEVMTNLQSDLNGVKSRVWDTNVNVTSSTRFAPLAGNPTIRNTEMALDLLRGGIATFNYLNDATIQALLTTIHNLLKDNFHQFDVIFSILVPSQPPTNLEGLWTTFINFWAQRMANGHRTYATLRVTQLEAPWIAILASNPSGPVTAVANAALADIAQLSRRIGTDVLFNRTPFT